MGCLKVQRPSGNNTERNQTYTVLYWPKDKSLSVLCGKPHAAAVHDPKSRIRTLDSLTGRGIPPFSPSWDTSSARPCTSPCRRRGSCSSLRDRVPAWSWCGRVLGGRSLRRGGGSEECRRSRRFHQLRAQACIKIENNKNSKKLS